jgi:ABC-type phosphate transport system substrate-binding protein
MKRALCVTITTLGLAAASPASAADFKVVANPSVKASEISLDDLKSVFLGTRTSLPDGSQVEPVLAKGGATHEAFLKEYLGKSDSALSTYYRSLVFTGKGAMPKSLESDAEIAAYVARTKGAIGYVSAAATAPGTKTLDVK